MVWESVMPNTVQPIDFASPVYFCIVFENPFKASDIFKLFPPKAEHGVHAALVSAVGRGGDCRCSIPAFENGPPGRRQALVFHVWGLGKLHPERDERDTDFLPMPPRLAGLLAGVPRPATEQLEVLTSVHTVSFLLWGRHVNVTGVHAPGWGNYLCNIFLDEQDVSVQWNFLVVQSQES